MTKTIRVELTDEQVEQLQPMFEKARKRPNTGFVLAQIWESGHMVVGFATPAQVKQAMEIAIALYSPEPDTVGDAVSAALGEPVDEREQAERELADDLEWLGESPTETRNYIDF